MAEVKSTFRLVNGDQVPSFTLPDGAGKEFSLDAVKGTKGTLIFFTCNHCPFVVHLAKALGAFSKEIAEHGVNTVAINSNDIANYPADAPEKMVEFAAASDWDFPYLLDESQKVAHAYSAACTPDFFLVNDQLEIFYAGQFDSSRPKLDQPITGDDLRAAVQALVAGESAIENPYPSSGCNIKWKAGNEPPYFG